MQWKIFNFLNVFVTAYMYIFYTVLNAGENEEYKISNETFNPHNPKYPNFWKISHIL